MRWEYKVVWLVGDRIGNQQEIFLNRLGVDGWEAFHMERFNTELRVWLKRQVPV